MPTEITYTPKMARLVAAAEAAGYVVALADNYVEIDTNRSNSAIGVRMWLDHHTTSGAVGFVAGHRTDVHPNVATTLRTIGACAKILKLTI